MCRVNVLVIKMITTNLGGESGLGQLPSKTRLAGQTKKL